MDSFSKIIQDKKKVSEYGLEIGLIFSRMGISNPAGQL